MVPLWNPLLPAAAGNEAGQIVRGSEAKSLVSKTSAELSFSLCCRGRKCWVFSPADELQGFYTYIAASPYGVGFQGLGGP